ncbi:PLP-dependent aminotransferase family protein [Paenibacillus tritici]|uniref:PLP-dependent aminotransferase family protein n=1 Tax=Paenibacillus tritici TaxID=1873425 RepID=A0ABX2DV76_9BACL|nr:PLP-dependent aminotransferase family protein [Paenibacillus tritici]NQX47346.1 PLP-dependent aminotransferase family protein [Paenibacillus tritici]QUL55983.1 PLP-dependent aminotransferase family protein [Paenibacillus tritici]
MRKTAGAEPSHPLFRQVYEFMLKRIERGEWKADDKLPSIRQLADELGVHRLTVFKAYRALSENGKLYVKDKSGYYVTPGSKLDRNIEEGAGVAGYRVRSPMSDIQRLPVTYQFSQALIDPGLLPNLFLSDYVKKVFDLYPKVMGTYSSVQGDEELRTTLSSHFHERYRLQLSARELLITSGAQQAINLIAGIMLGPMDAVLVERPTYSVALDIFRRAGARLVAVEISPQGYDLAAVEELMRRHKPRMFYINPTHHNPTGYTVPAKQRKLLVELAERYRCLIVEDDPFRDMYFLEEPPPPFFAYDTEGWVMYISSFSKYVAPGLRICAVACRYPFMERLIAAKSLADNGTPLLNQKIFLHYYTSPRLQQHLGKLRIALQVHKEIMEEELAATGWEWLTPQGGLSLWVKLPEAVPVDKLLARCLEHSISFVPGEICDPLGEMKSWLRLSYSFASEALLREGVRRLTAIAREIEAEEGS